MINFSDFFLLLIKKTQMYHDLAWFCVQNSVFKGMLDENMKEHMSSRSRIPITYLPNIYFFEYFYLN